MEVDDARAGPSFSMVLAGGGARGFAHVGVLRALEAEGLRPEAIVGVSMGAVIGATYSLRSDWYRALLDLDTSYLQDPLLFRGEGNVSPWEWIRGVGNYLRITLAFTFGWGIGEKLASRSLEVLKRLTRERSLEEGRVPVAVCATDLRSGSRVILRSGPAAEAVFASASIAGVFPPRRHGDHLLVDGVYADIAPVDVARDLSPPRVLVVDATQSLASTPIRNGFQAMLRAVEICQMRHADLRFDAADYVLRPSFRRTIDTFDFNARRECVAAGVDAVRKHRTQLRRMFSSGPGAIDSD